MADSSRYGPTILRILVGVLFLITGFFKLANPGSIIGELGSIGIPASGFFGWLQLIVEILGGVLLIIGWKVRYTVWPLILILLGAVFFVYLPGFGKGQMGVFGSLLTIMLHIIVIGALVSLFLTGAGAWAVDKGGDNPVALYRDTPPATPAEK